MIIPIKGYYAKNQIVVNDALDKSSDIEYHLKRNSPSENWVAASIRALDGNLQPILPYAPMLKEKIEDSNGRKQHLFDFTRERIKRDAKRLLSITRAITWLHQKQRRIIEKGGMRFVISEPEDFLVAIELFAHFFNLTYTGLDHRLQNCFERIRQLEGKHAEQIVQLGYPAEYSGWVLRHVLQEDLGIGSVNTIKGYIKTLKDRLWVEGHYNQSIPKGYLVRSTQGVNQGINRVSLPVSLGAVRAYLTGYLTPCCLKEVYGGKKIRPIKLDFLKSSVICNEIDTLKVDTHTTSAERLTRPDPLDQLDPLTYDPQKTTEVRRYVKENANEDGSVDALSVEELFDKKSIAQAEQEGVIAEIPRGRYRIL